MSSVNNNIPFVPENTIDPAAGLNESLLIIDRLLQLKVIAVKQNTPAVGSTAGDRYIVGASPTGAWAGKALQVAEWMPDGYWGFSPASVAVYATSVYINTGTDWVPASAGAGASWGGITGSLGDQADLAAALSGKESELIAGANITIDRSDPEAPVISSSGGGAGGMTNPMTAAGDVIVGGASGAPARLPIGAEGQVPVVRSGALVYEAQAGGAVPFAPVVVDATTSRVLALADAGSYFRFTNAAATSCTVPSQSSVAWAAYTEVHIRRVGAGNLTITAGAGVTLNPPSGGTLVLTAGMSVTLKRVAADAWDVIGQTVPV